MALPSPLETEALLGHARREGWWFRAKEDIVRDFLRPFLRPGASVVVLGSGGGSTVRRLRELAPDCSIVGLDVDPQAVAACASHDPHGRYRVADVETDPLGLPASADVVIALDILEHLRDDAGAAARVANLLRPGGVCAVNVPAHPWLFSDHDRHLGHVRRYRPAEVEALLRGAGLRILHATPLFSLTLILLTAWRHLVKPLLRSRPHASDVGMTLPWPVDLALYAVARAEGWVARARLPFGSSHFVLARKPS